MISSKKLFNFISCVPESAQYIGSNFKKFAKFCQKGFFFLNKNCQSKSIHISQIFWYYFFREKHKQNTKIHVLQNSQNPATKNIAFFYLKYKKSYIGNFAKFCYHAYCFGLIKIINIRKLSACSHRECHNLQGYITNLSQKSCLSTKILIF